MSKRILTVTQWLNATSGFHLKDEAREVAALGDGGWLSIQASRYHFSEPRIDNARYYKTVEIGSKGVLEGPPEAADQLAAYARSSTGASGGASIYARVPIDVADRYVTARGGIVVPI